jgi:restriction system protein
VQLKQYRIQRRFVDELRSAMPRHGGSEGIIISTEPVGRTAREIAASPGERPVRIIDGPELASLLIRHRLGVRVVAFHYEADPVLEVDEDFFAAFRDVREAASKPHSSSRQQQKAYPLGSLRETIRAVFSDPDHLMIRLVVEPIIAAALVGCVVLLVAFLLKHVFHLPTT